MILAPTTHLPHTPSRIFYCLHQLSGGMEVLHIFRPHRQSVDETVAHKDWANDGLAPQVRESWRFALFSRSNARTRSLQEKRAKLLRNHNLLQHIILLKKFWPGYFLLWIQSLGIFCPIAHAGVESRVEKGMESYLTCRFFLSHRQDSWLRLTSLFDEEEGYDLSDQFIILSGLYPPNSTLESGTHRSFT